MSTIKSRRQDLEVNTLYVHQHLRSLVKADSFVMESDAPGCGVAEEKASRVWRACLECRKKKASLAESGITTRLESSTSITQET